MGLLVDERGRLNCVPQRCVEALTLRGGAFWAERWWLRASQAEIRRQVYHEAGAEGETVFREEKGPGTKEDRESPGDLSPGCTRWVQSWGVGLGKARRSVAAGWIWRWWKAFGWFSSEGKRKEETLRGGKKSRFQREDSSPRRFTLIN